MHKNRKKITVGDAEPITDLRTVVNRMVLHSNWWKGEKKEGWDKLSE